MNVVARAWWMIGWDDGKFRIVGERAMYEAVMYKDGGDKIKLARLDTAVGLKEVSRYVDPNTMLVFKAEDFKKWKADVAILPTLDFMRKV